MNANIDDILKELGWDDGFRIPVANEENKRLEEEVRSFFLFLLCFIIFIKYIVFYLILFYFILD